MVTVTSGNGIAFHTAIAVARGSLAAYDEYGYGMYVPLDCAVHQLAGTDGPRFPDGRRSGA